MLGRILKKFDRIEKLLLELSSKIEHLVGFEGLSSEEKKEIEKIENEIQEGKYKTFEEVFSD